VTVVLDSAALTALVQHDRGLHALLTAVRAEGQRVVIPTVILAETMTGKASDAALWHAVNRLPVQDATTAIAARAGALRERAEATRPKKRDLTIDALVAATAEAHAPAVVVTADTMDLARLTASADVRVASLDGHWVT
jgi:predicted nucleic acid-binding protein